MAVAKNDSGTPQLGGGGSVTSRDLTTFTVSAGSNLVLMGFLHTSANVSATSMTWNGVSMTSLGSALASDSTSRCEIFYLLNPATGNQTMHAAWTTSSAVVIGAIAFSGGTTPDNLTTANDGGSASTRMQVTVTSATDGATVGALTESSNNTNASNESGTQIYRDDVGFVDVGATYTIGGTSNLHEVDCNSPAKWSAIGCRIPAFSGGASVTYPQLERYGFRGEFRGEAH